MAKTPEGEIKDIVKKSLKSRNIWYIMIVPSTYGRATGISDFQLLYKGHFIVIETKKRSDKKGPTPNQQDYMDAVECNGGKAFVVRNESDMAIVESYLDSL